MTPHNTSAVDARSLPGERYTVVTFSRMEKSADCALPAARIIRLINTKGLDVALIVRGARPETVGRAQRLLSSEAGREIDVRAYSDDRTDILADIDLASVVIMPVPPTGFGAIGLDAAIAGVPLLVPACSGVGMFLADPNRYPPELTERMLVAQNFDDPTPIDRWTERLYAVLTDLSRARAQSLALRRHLQQQNRTMKGASESLAAIERATAAAAGKTRLRYDTAQGVASDG